DVRSIGAGGGSIGWVDDGGLLHVGPQSAGSVPGPACYGRGGTRPTVTDASLSLGYIDAGYFLGGAMDLDVDLAREALERDVGAIARRLDAPLVLVPEVAPSLSAAGALLSDLARDFAAAHHTTAAGFDFAGVNRLLDRLRAESEAFAAGPGRSSVDSSIELSVEARYPHQVWDLEVPVRRGRFESPDDVEELRTDFHVAHRELFAISDDRSEVEFLSWR